MSSNRTFVIASLVLYALVIPYLVFICFLWLGFNIDEGLVTIGADLIGRGGVPYRDLFDVKWPGSYYLLALIFKLFGSSFAVARTTVVIEILTCMVLTATISRMLIKNWPALLPQLILLIPLAGWNFNIHHWDALLGYLACSALLMHLVDKPKPSLGLTLVAGILGTFSIFCTQVYGPAVLLSYITFATINYKLYRSRQNLLYIISVLIGTLAVVFISWLIYLVNTESLKAMYLATIYFPLTGYGYMNQVPYGYTYLNFLARAVNILHPSLTLTAEAYLCELPNDLVKISPAIPIVSSIIYFARGNKLSKTISTFPALSLLIVMAYGLWSTSLHLPDRDHLVWGCQLLTILSVYFLNLMPNIIPESAFGLFLLCVGFIFGIIANVTFETSGFFPDIYWIETRRGIVPTIMPDTNIINAIERLVPRNGKILVYPYRTVFYFFTHTLPPSRFPLLQYNYNSCADFKEMMVAMDKEQLPYVVWDLWQNQDIQSIDFPYRQEEILKPEEPIMEQYLRNNYQPKKLYWHYLLLERKPKNN